MIVMAVIIVSIMVMIEPRIVVPGVRAPRIIIPRIVIPRIVIPGIVGRVIRAVPRATPAIPAIIAPAVEAVVRVGPAPRVDVIINYHESILPAGLLFFDPLGSKSLEILFAKRLCDLHVLVETFIVNAVLKALGGIILT